MIGTQVPIEPHHISAAELATLYPVIRTLVGKRRLRRAASEKHSKSTHRKRNMPFVAHSLSGVFIVGSIKQFNPSSPLSPFPLPPAQTPLGCPPPSSDEVCYFLHL